MTAGWSEGILYLLRLHRLALTATLTFLVADASILAFVRFGRKRRQSGAKKPSPADRAPPENIANEVRQPPSASRVTLAAALNEKAGPISA